MINLKDIYRPIDTEIAGVEKLLRDSLENTGSGFISELNRFLLESPGKRIRSALVILSAKASLGTQPSALNGQSSAFGSQLAKIASAVELIHMASLVHDDVIDYSCLRHNKPTINSKWGGDIAIALGDYLYSVAFDLISTCGNMEILQCITSAAKAMCEGELFQVSRRDNLSLLKEQCIVIVKKKTASLFAASCQAGVLTSGSSGTLESTLKEYGLNLGISFQIIDDYLDLVGEEENLGKIPGQDIRAGEITLPLLHILESVPEREKEELKASLFFKDDRLSLEEIKLKLHHSGAGNKTKETALFYISTAKEKIKMLPSSPYKESFLRLSDFIMERGFNGQS